MYELAKIEKAKELVEVYSLELALDQVNAILEDEKYLQLFNQVAYSLMDIKGYVELETAEMWLLSAKVSSPAINEACHSLF